MAERATHWAKAAAELAAQTEAAAELAAEKATRWAAEVAEVAAEVAEGAAWLAAEDKWWTLHHHCKSCDRSLNYWCVAVAACNVNAYILKIKIAISRSSHGKQVPQLLVPAMLGRLARSGTSSGAAAAVEGRSSGRQRRDGLRGAAMT